MKSSFYWLAFGIALVLAGSLVAEEPQQPPSKAEPAAKKELPKKGTAKEWHVSRQQGWQAANYIIEVLEQGDAKEFPGIAAWLKEYKEAVKEIDFKADPATWPMVDIDGLVTKNPSYWRAYYEIAPGDPGLAMLHGGLLLFGGEPRRGSTLVAAFQQRPDIPKPINRVLDSVVANGQQASKESSAKVLEGAKLYDEGKYDEALKLHEEALKLNPQDGFAHYEWGLTLRQKQWLAAGIKPPEGDKIVVSDKSLKFSPEVAAAFSQARRHDPFQWKAYQGEDRAVIEALQSMVKKVMPNWDLLTKTRPGRIETEQLTQLDEGCQEAQIDELALVLRSVLVARRGRYAPEDHPFIAKSVRTLAPGKITDEVVDKLAGKQLKLRQIVAPER
jgi:tetratricopeptide (TPR) repeat protein